MQLSCVIPTYNGLSLLKKSLPKLEKALQGIRSEIIIVDNGSSDKTGAYVKKNYTSAKLISLDKNYGFTKAVNEGVRAALGQYILVFNNDCFVKPSAVSKFLSYAKKNNLDVTQPIVVNPKGQIENIGFVIDMKYARAKVITEKENVPSKSITDGRYVYGLSGTCLLIKKSTFVSAGMFDESFHSYLEDVDLFMRLASTAHYKPCVDVTVEHHHMATSKKMGTYKQQQDLKNWIRIILKNYSFIQVVQWFPHLFLERLRNVSGLMKAYF